MQQCYRNVNLSAETQFTK